MAHLHEVRDMDTHFVIDPVTRVITNPNSQKNKLMQGDHNSEIYTFEIPKLVEGHDMSLCNQVRIHYNDIASDKANESKDVYTVNDLHIDIVESDTITFSWLISGNATKYAGLLSFRIQFLCIDESGAITYKWHTEVFKGITVSDGFDNTEAVVEEYSDTIAEWEARLDALEASGGADWNASEGEPGHVLNRTHWVERVENVELLPKCEPEYIEDDNSFMITEGVPVLSAGEKYTVTWNGVGYTCVCQSVSAISPGAVLLGDGADFGLPGAGEPFAIVGSLQDGIYSIKIIPRDGTTELFFSIWGVVEIVHKLPGKYLPDGAVRADVAQTLTEEEKAQARANIGAVSDAEALAFSNVKAVNHRGYCTEAPENTIPAYILSKQKGFNYVEADISFTKDGRAVLLHDSTIDRTSDGTGNIADLTYAELMQYDFGSWKSAAYAGTKISTFEEFIKLCRNLGLHPYIEIKGGTESQIKSLVATVKKYGMKGKVTWISFGELYLGYIKAADNAERLGYVVSNVTSNTITTAQGLQTDKNEVFIDANYSALTDENVDLCVAADIPLEVWTVDSSTEILTLNPYVSGVTSDNLIASKVLHDRAVVYTPPIVTPVRSALIDIDFTNAGINRGTGGDIYNATTGNGGTYANGKFVIDGSGYLSVPTEFMAVDSETPWTVVFKIDTGKYGPGTYTRFARGSNDIPAVYLCASHNAGKEYSALQFKGACNFNANIAWRDESKIDTAGIVYTTPPTVIGLRNDGTHVSIWINGEMVAEQLSSYYNQNSYASNFQLGDGAMSGWDPQYAEYGMLKLWNVALTDEEMLTVSSL